MLFLNPFELGRTRFRGPVDNVNDRGSEITQILVAGDQGVEPRCDAPEASALPLSQSPNRLLPECRLGPQRGPLASSSNPCPFSVHPVSPEGFEPSTFRVRTCCADPVAPRTRHFHLPPSTSFISSLLVGSMGYDPIVFRLKAGGFVHLSYEPNRFGPCFFFKLGFDIVFFFPVRAEGFEPPMTRRPTRLQRVTQP